MRRPASDYPVSSTVLSTRFREFLDLLDAQVPRRLAVHIIMDNYGTQKIPLIRNWFAKPPRFRVLFTTAYRSWLSLVERGSP
jgi:transposase